jgi:hypothetical protein
MRSRDKNYLLKRLAETHSAIQTILEGIDLELPVYPDSDWRIRDILGHIATWDREVTKSLRAFLTGIEYVIPGVAGDETDFNERAVIAQRELSTQQIIAVWEQAREEFKAALNDIPMDRLPDELLYPWGDERGSIAKMVEYMIEHDEEHRDEMIKAIKASHAD